MRRADNLTTFLCRLSRNSGASAFWNPCSGKALPLYAYSSYMPPMPPQHEQGQNYVFTDATYSSLNNTFIPLLSTRTNHLLLCREIIADEDFRFVWPDDEDSRLHRNVGKFRLGYTVSHPNRQHCSLSPQSEQ